MHPLLPPPFNLEIEFRKTNEDRESLRPTREQFRIISGESYDNGLRAAYKQVLVDQRKLKYKGSLTSAKLLSAEKATKDELLKISRFLNNTNFRKFTRYMVLLSKLHWFKTIHHMGTEREGIARSLEDAPVSNFKNVLQ